jgi:TetR/AcrR family transcriptional repressor of lmrAB and yxaGH operons
LFALSAAAVAFAGEMIQMILDMLRGHAERHRSPKAFLRAYCATMAGWMEEAGFRSGCPIATTLLETAPHSPGITGTGRRAIDEWVEVISDVFARGGGMTRRESHAKA